MRILLGPVALTLLLVTIGGCKTYGIPAPVSDGELFRQGYLQENEHFISHIGSTDMAALLFVIPKSKLEAQPHLNLHTNLPPISHSQAIDLALRSAGKDYEHKKHYVESCVLRRLTAETEDRDDPDWNWGRGKFYWDVGIQFFNEKNDTLSIDTSTSAAVLMDGDVIAPVHRVMPEYKGTPEYCEREMRAVFCAIAIYKLRHGDFPNTMNDLTAIASPSERSSMSECFMCSDGITPIVYSKPSEDSDPDFIMLRCPKHTNCVFKFREIKEVIRAIEEDE
ncbi:MAG: hypothetical protein PHP44_06015 [Kiritimatiellae bacterium]|nr:hypothetical protein [Kiritimatiellia bacterium]